MKKIELLAPAGNLESMYAAIGAGADAVYLGGNRFSARAYAQNFDDKNMENAVEYCHLNNTKVYVTVNTIIKEKELDKAYRYAKLLYNMGVDALIVQDIGLSSVLQEMIPNLELHASTQMTVHNGETATFLNKRGFKRIVLSRELSLKEIGHISKNLGIETEIFIHGALCICYSGQCLMSSIIGGRSGNRGRCAQPCRLPYEIIDAKGKSRKKGYLLSPKDMCTIENIGDIIKTGVYSLKIEGRMKRPEYVAGVVKEYRNVIDNFYKNPVMLKNISCLNHSKKNLLQLFNREGFSKAYLFGNTGRDMMSYSFPNNTGIKIGRVNRDGRMISLTGDISVGDGVKIANQGFAVSKIFRGNKEVLKAHGGESVKLNSPDYKYRENGENAVYKTSDFSQNKNLRGIYRNALLKKFKLSLIVRFQQKKPIALCTSYGGIDFKVEGKKVEKALKCPLSKERICKSLNKTGKEIFEFENIEFKCFENGFLPISALNEVRRDLLKKIKEYVLIENRRDSNLKDEIHHPAVVKNRFADKKLPSKIIFVSTDEQLRAVLESDFQYICINPFQREKIKVDLGSLEPKKIYVKIPNIIRGEFSCVKKFIDENLDSIEGIVTANLGMINEFKNKVRILGDYKLNITNSPALDFYGKITNGDCLSVELNRHEIEDIIKKSNTETQLLIYGKIELMVSEYCVIGSTVGDKCSFRNCSGVCREETFSLLDRKKKSFALRTDRFCRSYIYNTVPVNLISNVKELRDMGIDSFRADFIDEDYDETKKILSYFQKEVFEGDFSRFTRGHYKNGVK
ncbi:MAG TPA: peptidase [Clostridium sp.]|jgi:putative protease|uniref:U32 family peptidase n=1 Tax=Clostridium lapidicellarium TaxID=3240931 RepID=A0ABV4DXP1_9CLOT|nr:U32 family peptidase [uncultured Clostridium sp.]NLU08796.1 U32 family peptidase [Clostridiales bacterium]HBC96053.1 peptidase [Clostridium sp.]